MLFRRAGLIQVGPSPKNIYGIKDTVGRTNPLAAAGVTRWRCGLWSKFFDHLLSLLLLLSLLCTD